MMKKRCFLTLLMLSTSSSAGMSEEYSSKVMLKFKDEVELFLSQDELTDKMRHMEQLSQIPIVTSAPRAMRFLNQDVIIEDMTKKTLKQSLYYATSICLTQGFLLQIYKKCLHFKLTEQMDNYYDTHVGKDEEIDTLFDDFFSLQFSMENVKEGEEMSVKASTKSVPDTKPLTQHAYDKDGKFIDRN